MQTIESLLLSGAAESVIGLIIECGDELKSAKARCRITLDTHHLHKFVYAAGPAERLNAVHSFLLTGKVSNKDGSKTLASESRFRLSLPKTPVSSRLTFTVQALYTGKGLAEVIERLLDPDQLTRAERKDADLASRQSKTKKGKKTDSTADNGADNGTTPDASATPTDNGQQPAPVA